MAYPPNSTLPPAQLPAVLQELGPASSDVVSVDEEGGDSWIVKFENDGLVYLSWREQPPRLELMTPFATLPDTAARDAHRILLMFNFLSADTEGCRMALSGIDDTLVLIRDLPEASFSLRAVQSALRGMVDLAGTWKVVLTDLHERCDEPPQALLAQQFS